MNKMLTKSCDSSEESNEKFERISKELKVKTRFGELKIENTV